MRGDDGQLPVIVVGCDEGTLAVSPVDGADAVLVSLSVGMEPNRGVLAPPTG